jgi:ethanolamine-phosphate cytidylyltransferase
VSDEEILLTKGPPILNIEERVAIVESCKWVTEIEKNADYTPYEPFLDRLNCQYYAHGDDIPISANGDDVCHMLRAKGRFKMFKRTTGVSTTDITGRLLRLVAPERPLSL